MSLSRMIAQHDDLALEALSSKGLLRRAKRELESGLATIDSISDTEATFSVGNETICLSHEGLLASHCTCKASGVCRHIVLSVLMLREQLDAKVEEFPQTSAIDQLSALTEQHLIKYAGVDWQKALSLVKNEMAIEFETKGVNVTARLIEFDASVTFIAGTELKEAVYKGVKSRRRLLTVLAVLLIRKQQGVQLKFTEEAVDESNVTHEFIDEAQATIERAVLVTLPGRSGIAKDLFLELAISMRVEALPRLSSELRSLANESDKAKNRQAEFDAAAFLKLASRSYALLESLRVSPADSILTGVLRREYKSEEPLELLPLGVTRWRSSSGARGLSGYCLNPSNGSWLTVNEGRAPGTDPGFNILTAYNMPLWGAGTLSNLIGHPVNLANPMVASDGSLSVRSSGGSQLNSVVAIKDIAQINSTHVNWESLKHDLNARLGDGLSRRPVPIPALIAPTDYGQIGFDDLNQCYHWDVRDELGRSLILQLPVKDEEVLLRLWRLGNKIQAMVIEARYESGSLSARPVSIVTENRSGVRFYNVDFDTLPVKDGFAKMMANWRERAAKPLVLAMPNEHSVKRLLMDVSDALVGVVEGGTTLNGDKLVDQVESCGLFSLLPSLKKSFDDRAIRSVLASIYLVGEMEALESFF